MQLLLLCLALMQPYLEYCIWFQCPQHKKDVRVLESIQMRTPKLVPGQEVMFSEGRLSALGLLSLEKKRLRGNPNAVHSSLKGDSSGESAGLFS